MAVVRQQAMDQRGLKTLALWCAWAVTCALIFGSIYHRADIWSFIAQDRTRVTWIILSVFGFGLLASFLQTVLLTLEWFRIYRVESMLQQRSLTELPSRTGWRVVDRALATLRALGERGSHTDFGTLVEIEFSGHRRASRLVTLLGNLLITLGLIGTVLGMTLTLTGLTGAIHAIGEDQARMMEGLRHAMMGMGVAFYTTLLGAVLGGILLRVFSYITETSVEGLEDRLLRIALLKAAPQASEAEALADLVRQGASLERRLREMGALLEHNREALRAFAEEVERLGEVLRRTGESDELLKQIAIHRHYARLLAYELQLAKRIGGFRGYLYRWLGIGGGGRES